MRSFVVALGLITLASCPEQIGDRCGEQLPPCPSGTACIAGHCKEVIGGGGGSGGGASGGIAGGLMGGGSAGGIVVDSGADAGGLVIDAGIDGGLDAGELDAGTDGGDDAGLPRDAGRVLVVVRRDLYVQTDGGLDEYPRPGEVMTALFLLVDGGELRVPMASNDAGVFVAEHAPAGAWMVETLVSGAGIVIFEPNGDRVDLSSTVYRGRPGPPVANMTQLSFNLTVQPWGEFDSLELVAQRAGSLIVVSPPLNLGDISVSGQIPATAFRGPTIQTDDDLRISQVKTNTLDSGVEVASIAGTASLSGTSVPGSVIAATLIPPSAIGRLSVRLDAGALLASLGGQNESCSIYVSEEISGVRTSTDPSVVFADMFQATSLDIDVPYPGRTGVNGLLRCSRASRAPVPLSDGGFERTDAGQLNVVLGTTVSTVDRLTLDGGVFAPPTVSAPRAILIDGQPNPLVSSQSPTISWDAPFVGNPNRYTAVVWLLTRSGTSFRREALAWLYTQNRQVRIPSGILMRGQRYSIQVTGTQTRVSSPSRPFSESLPSSSGAVFSSVFVVNRVRPPQSAPAPRSIAGDLTAVVLADSVGADERPIETPTAETSLATCAADRLRRPGVAGA